MILIKLLGIDKYMAEEVVEDIHKPVADIFETEKENVLFYAPESMLIYNGMEQTSYQLNIEIECPNTYKQLEKEIANCISKLVMEKICVHLRILFTYFDENNEYEFINKNYPRFMTKDNVAHFEQEDSNQEPYLGNAFADYENRVKEKEIEQAKQERERLAKKNQ